MLTREIIIETADSGRGPSGIVTRYIWCFVTISFCMYSKQYSLNEFKYFTILERANKPDTIIFFLCGELKDSKHLTNEWRNLEGSSILFINQNSLGVISNSKWTNTEKSKVHTNTVCPLNSTGLDSRSKICHNYKTWWFALSFFIASFLYTIFFASHSYLMFLFG